ncbi:acyl-CoA synthetase [Brevibacillus sp. NRS-1366]|uniref:acyl-CoA synthetase n=1 Tax=Brevibacillus sp. NRS-1366 TaxID=3233899 RepID=UPI003D2519D2
MLETTVGQLFDKAVRQYPDKVAIKDLQRSITYAELEKEVNGFANALIQLGICHGDRVAIWLYNSIEYVVADFAIAKIGAVRVPLNQFLSVNEVQYRMQDSGTKAIISSPEWISSVQTIVKNLPYDVLVINTGKEPVDQESMMHQLIENSSFENPAISIGMEDLVAIMYTGGTTGRSKGVMHTHKSTIALMYSQIVEQELERGVVLLHVAPLAHATGFFILSGFLRGGTHILLQSYSPRSFCETVEREKVSFVFLVPTMIYHLLDFPERTKYDLSTLKTIQYGASPMAPTRIKQALEEFGPILMQSYSQMEVANQTTVLTKKDHQTAQGEENRLASCGREVILSQVRIVNVIGEDVGHGEVGEIMTRGPHMMKGYWQLEEETAKVIKDGWLHTGDMAYRDEHGYIYLVDRKKDMVISGGFNVYSTVVESVLFQHPAVKQAAVIGVPDDHWGEAIKAIVVVHPETGINEEEIIAFCKSRLAKYEVPKTIHFVDSIPVTAYGKVDKKALRAPYWSDQGRQVN